MSNTMKHSFYIFSFITIINTAIQADCSILPDTTVLKQYIIEKKIPKAQELLNTLRNDTESFLLNCQDKGKQQEASLALLTLQQDLSDMEKRTQKQSNVLVDCTKVPDDAALLKATTQGDKAKVKLLYHKYHSRASAFLDHCTSHPEFELAYETYIQHDETYAN